MWVVKEQIIKNPPTRCMWYLRCYACDVKQAKYKGFCMQWCSEECHQLLEKSRNEKIPTLYTLTWRQHLTANLSWPLETLDRLLYKHGFRWSNTDWLGLLAHRLRVFGGLRDA